MSDDPLYLRLVYKCYYHVLTVAVTYETSFPSGRMSSPTVSLDLRNLSGVKELRDSNIRNNEDGIAGKGRRNESVVVSYYCWYSCITPIGLQD